jgi:hypothetical protein
MISGGGPEYRNHFEVTHKGKDIILDNGMYEGERVGEHDLISIINKIEPKLVFLPDTFQAFGDANYILANQFLQGHVEFKTKYAFIPHGSAEVMHNDIKRIAENPLVTHIGVPKKGWEVEFESRGHLQTWLESIEPKFRYHWLGLNSPSEIREAKRFNKVESFDTCLPYLYAIYDKVLEFEIADRLEKPINYFDIPLSPENETLKINLQIFKELIDE